MKQHKWYNEIVAWASGAEIEQADIRENANPRWYEADNPPNWETTFYKYRIKPQHKEPRYLYVYKLDGYSIRISQNKDNDDSYQGQFLGKIKLEVDDETSQ